MKGIIKTKREAKCVSLEDIEKPKLENSHEVMVQIHSAAICGSDLHAYEYIASYQNFMRVPVVLGHECSGVVVEIGSAVTEFKIGDRVMGESNVYCGKCRNCRTGNTHVCENNLMRGLTTDGVMREYVPFLEQNLHHVPDNLSFNEAAAAQAATVSVHGVLRRFNINAGSIVVVTGVGIIGLVAAQLAKLCGATNVIVAGTDADMETRIPIAQGFGFQTLNCQKEPISEFLSNLTSCNKADYVLECSGASSAINAIPTYLRKGGEVLLLGLPGKAVSFPFADVIRSEINIRTTYTSTWQDYEDTLRLLSNNNISISPTLKEYSLDNVREAFEAGLNKEALKPVFKFL
ncbi:MAG: alcohol dehydrogenase catalytic domain-containing protein [Synergistes jonesii]|uniref:zinc-dependent alcohol dehydrogenase n=1 Tax=Synergistes jonesii TaxID=2754 RepID=UPI002A752A29|nr:alcohol dehydrogenase catalytic domain-containing protein [Synergistes jonesii]MDY2984990.1 alcohol dehydrogenase catalytic domain-containing protein [Synergistes jonesii]